MIQTVPQLLFTVHMKKIKYTVKNENGISIPARDYAKHIAIERVQYLPFQTTALKNIKFTGT